MERKNKDQKSESLITEELFREAYQYEEVRKPPIKKAIAKFFRCTKEKALNFLPIARWLPKYNIKNNILGDIIAGVTVAVMHIPHGLAYAPLGKVEPVVGFYMAVFPVIIYMFLGTSRHISIGTFAVLCAMVGEIVGKYETPDPSLPAANFTANSTNGTLHGPKTDTYHNLEIGTAVCLMVGVWQAGLGLLRLGSLTVIMSESLVSGFTTGAAVHVLSYQLKNLFGINIGPHSGVLKLIYIYIDFFQKITTVNLVTMSISIVCIAILFLFNEYLKPLIQKKFPKNKIPIPIELIVILLGILLSFTIKLNENYSVGVVGHIPKGFPKPAVPQLGSIRLVIVDSMMIALVALAINLSLARIFAKKSFYRVSSNQEFFAYGVANIFASFFSSLPSAASLSRSTIQFAVGGKTQLASLFSVILIIFVLLFAGPLFEPVPYCVLSSIVAVTLKGLLMQICDVCQIWKQNYWDGIVWVGTFLAVIILDLDYGLVVGIALSLISLICASFSFQVNVLGRVPQTNIYLDIEHFKSAQPVPNVVILQVFGNLNFSNSNRFETIILEHSNRYLELTNTEENKQLYIVLNMSSVTNMDPTSVNSLRHIYTYLSKSKCELYLTDCNLIVYRTFEVCNLYKDFPKDHVLASVADAVEYIVKNNE